MHHIFVHRNIFLFCETPIVTLIIEQKYIIIINVLMNSYSFLAAPMNTQDIQGVLSQFI